MTRVWIAAAVSAAALLWGHSVFAQDGVTAAMAFYSLDNIVLLFSAILVLFMQAGFAPHHAEHMAEYGAHNEERMTGVHETASFEKFSFGVSDRGASIRIPIYTVEHGWKGYLEDRRPASNADPYRVTSRILKTYAEAHDSALKTQ
jgi:glutamine synthetase